MPPKFEPSSKICEIVQLTPSRKSEVRWAVWQKKSKQYYDVNVKRSQFKEGQWVLGKEVLAPIDVVYGSVDDEDRWEDYGAFVEDMRDRAVNAFAQVRSTLGRAAERSKQYYDVNVKRSQFKEGQWVWYFNLRKFPRRQMKWRRQYEGPYLVTRILSPLTVEIQRSAKSRPKKVHIDKLKDFVGSPPLDWRSPSSEITADENEVSDTRLATVGASSVSVAWPASTAKDAGERWKELQGNVGAQSEGIPVEAVEKPAEKKPPSYTVGCSDDFSRLFR